MLISVFQFSSVGKNRMKRYGKIIVSIAFLLAIAAGAAWLSGQRRAELDGLALPKPLVYAVNVEPAEKGVLALTRQYIGTIFPVDHATISFRVTGHLQSADGEPGDVVAEGEVVAKVDDRLLFKQKEAITAELEGARSEVTRAKKQVERRRPLLARGLIDPEAVDASESAYEVARARVGNLEARLAAADIDIAYSTAFAPFDGVITARYKRQGDLVMPGVPVYTIENPDAGYMVMVKIPRETVLAAASGDKASVSFGSRKMEAVLYRIYPSTQEGRLAMAELRMDKRPFGLPSGSFVTVELLVENKKGILVPARSILEDGAGARVFRVDDQDRVEIVDVTVLGRKAGDAVIAGPVSPGDRLVAAEASMLLHLSSGSRVRPMDSSGDGDIRR